MESNDIWDAETARSYDTPGEGMFAPEVLDPTVDRLAALAEGGRALEFAIGTGPSSTMSGGCSAVLVVTSHPRGRQK